MVLRHTCTTVALCAAIALCAAAVQAQGIGERHIKVLGKDCASCHEEVPATKAPPESRCTGCHGGLKELGSRLQSKGTANPHLNHVEELYCRDCHHAHKASENYCSQCHDDAFLGVKVP